MSPSIKRAVTPLFERVVTPRFTRSGTPRFTCAGTSLLKRYTGRPVPGHDRRAGVRPSTQPFDRASDRGRAWAGQRPVTPAAGRSATRSAGPWSALLAGAAALLLVATAPAARGAAAQLPGHPHAPRAGCADTSLLFCEDFDALPPGSAQSPAWSTMTDNGGLTVEPTAPGGNDLHISTQGNGSAFLQVNGFAPPGNSFWGRVRLRVDAFPTAPDWAHWTLVEATGDGAGFVRPLGGQYVPDAGADLWGVGSDGGPTGDWTAWQRSAPATAGVWQCVEWRMDATDNRISVWIDGKPKPNLTVDTTHHGGNPVDFVFPAFHTVKLGWQLYQANPAPAGYDVRLDDIALSGDRVGCAGGTGAAGAGDSGPGPDAGDAG